MCWEFVCCKLKPLGKFKSKGKAILSHSERVFFVLPWFGFTQSSWGSPGQQVHTSYSWCHSEIGFCKGAQGSSHWESLPYRACASVNIRKKWTQRKKTTAEEQKHVDKERWAGSNGEVSVKQQGMRQEPAATTALPHSSTEGWLNTITVSHSKLNMDKDGRWPQESTEVITAPEDRVREQSQTLRHSLKLEVAKVT